MHFTKKEKEMFDDYDKAVKDEESRLMTAKAFAKEEGIEIGEKIGEKRGIEIVKKQKIEIAKNSLKIGIDINSIKKIKSVNC